MSEPDLTAFEREISDAADAVYQSAKTGYNWGKVDELLKQELELDGRTRCKKANNSGRAANVLTESMDKPIQLYMVFIAAPYTVKRFLRVAKDRIERFPNVNTVVILDRTGGSWRARAIVERRGIGLAEEIMGSFPTLGPDDIYYVGVELPSTEPMSLPLEGQEDREPAVEEAIPSAPMAPEDEFATAMVSRTTLLDGLADLPERLIAFAEERGVILDLGLATDLLATTLSSQVILFAGPSGTGKSTMARLLRAFFATVDRGFEIEARRQWLTPEDLVGYYSVLGQRYATTTGTLTLVELHEASVAPVLGDQAVEGPPILLIEEMNLSSPEGYLAPVVHGLSGVSEPLLRWELHTQGQDAFDESAVVALPEVALIGPYPRVFGTVNVDASAHAPARKVVARSAVVLLEPTEMGSTELERLASASFGVEEIDEDPPGERFLGDPLTALEDAPPEEVAVLAAAFADFVGGIDGLLVDRRSARRSLAYMAYFRRLCAAETGSNDESLRLAAENAFTHCVLPNIETGRFIAALETLKKRDLVNPSRDAGELGGLLEGRVNRLLEMATDGAEIGGLVDFWSALS